MTLHIYAQEAWHDDAMIVGTLDDLRRLREALMAIVEDTVLMTAGPFFVNDGEGFTVVIIPESEEGMQHRSLPYTDPIASRRGPGKEEE
jgi:hypothetical protein